ncbi:MAG: transporter substrate-binding domain-containing protein [Oleiphilaceae bacterium]|nr:transporter substrate-binding domain-containing protein [Oleiphilaceae bacterium]
MGSFARITALVVILAVPALMEARTFSVRTLENPPLEYTDNGSVTGIAVELTREAIRRTGHDSEYKILPWKRVLLEVAEGRADVAINTGRSPEREIWGLYPDEVLIDETYVLFSYRPLSLPEDLGGVENLSLGNQLGYFYGEHFHKKITNERFRSVETMHTISRSLEKLAAGRTDLFIGDLLPTRYHISQMGLNDQIHRVQNEAADEPLVVSVSPTYAAFSRKTVSPEYVQAFSQALKDMKDDGTYTRILNTYLDRL